VRPAARTAAAFLPLLLVAAACSGGGDPRPDDDGNGRPSPGPLPTVTIDPDAASETDRAIAAAQQRLAGDADDQDARLALAVAFLAKARETSDPAYYDRADELLGDLVADRPDDLAVLRARGAQLLVQHRFEEALAVARHALGLAPADATVLAVEVDALNELGRYGEALEATQALADVRPDLASLARVSYARELHGDLDGAIVAMTQAFTAGSPDPLDVAFARVQLGDLLVLRRDLDAAEQSYAEALRAVPDLASARAGRARVAVARGDPSGAADILAPVVDRIPLPELAVAYGDALTAAGRPDEAARAYGLVDVLFALQSDAGVVTDLELALYLAEHRPGAEAVARAEDAVERRPNVGAWDALAWARFTAGDTDGAAAAITEALRLGTIDPRIRYHAAEIAAGDGDTAGAREHLEALAATNWRFSAIHVDDVEALAADLGVALP
jgi:tetratricopeptide (TPR) repeat protein